LGSGILASSPIIPNLKIPLWEMHEKPVARSPTLGTNPNIDLDKLPVKL
jgi:hypothetical protein